jgi:hypothetical protein
MTTPRLLAALAVLALVGAGCGSGAPSETATTSRAGGDREQAVEFAACMRENGLRDFPDPDAKGEFAYGISVSATVWQKTLDACKALRPPGSFSAERNPEQQQEGLRFAACMRENGVKDFPDPVDGEPLINTYRIPSSQQPGGMTILNAAVQQCRDPLGKAASGR